MQNFGSSAVALVFELGVFIIGIYDILYLSLFHFFTSTHIHLVCRELQRVAGRKPNVSVQPSVALKIISERVEGGVE